MVSKPVPFSSNLVLGVAILKEDYQARNIFYPQKKKKRLNDHFSQRQERNLLSASVCSV